MSEFTSRGILSKGWLVSWSFIFFKAGPQTRGLLGPGPSPSKIKISFQTDQNGRTQKQKITIKELNEPTGPI